jgi:hypothetical protein
MYRTLERRHPCQSRDPVTLSVKPGVVRYFSTFLSFLVVLFATCFFSFSGVAAAVEGSMQIKVYNYTSSTLTALQVFRGIDFLRSTTPPNSLPPGCSPSAGSLQSCQYQDATVLRSHWIASLRDVVVPTQTAPTVPNPPGGLPIGPIQFNDVALSKNTIPPQLFYVPLSDGNGSSSGATSRVSRFSTQPLQNLQGVSSAYSTTDGNNPYATFLFQFSSPGSTCGDQCVCKLTLVQSGSNFSFQENGGLSGCVAISQYRVITLVKDIQVSAGPAIVITLVFGCSYSGNNDCNLMALHDSVNWKLGGSNVQSGNSIRVAPPD